MFGFLGSLFDDSKMINKATDMIDDALFTEQEKADLKRDLVKSHTELIKIGWQDGNKTRSLTRRFIAFLVIIPYIIVFVLSVGFLFIDKTIATELLKIMQELHYIVLAIAGFYFGGQFLKK